MKDLFSELETHEALADGAILMHGFALADEAAILHAIEQVVEAAPFRHMNTPGGFRMSVAMTNCGAFGWVTDRHGYRYSPVDPQSGDPWPQMPPILQALAERAAQEAGYRDFSPDACLINRYEPSTKMSLHQDKDEQDFNNPIVSVSLGLPASFQFGGLKRTDPVRKYALHHGDVVVWGGPSRLFYHGILALKQGQHPLVGSLRLNLTFRKAV
ncbi:DNA oxidative demethylase AlkB [Falsochrobactrum shanghaiense]|uniref:Alpha-ketoglutarate-dependent dioxygenase AlkB n=1 Tax=Falsochrobactrum shanghaiense TaxID=2201899 RepID=A0A316J9Q5_9HYPH|nr:DNA oxidative demethylase AlkB [Falsochrobactrum shanghaiense]PWL18672.1 DNA oxidative demethylase AlkB [Falsochrobactrum shanghaiense]